METAGALDGGRKVWALAKTGFVANVAGNPADKLGAYVLLATSCDKSLATTVTFTSIRVVCQNTLAFAVNDLKENHRKNIKVNHSQKFDSAEIKTSLGLIDKAWSNFLAKINPMTEHPMSQVSARKYFESLFLTEKDIKESKPVSNAKSNEVNQLMSLYHSAQGQDIETAKDTLWGAVNAVSNYVDHVKSTKSGERIDSAWFGIGAALKEKAWLKAIELAQIE